MASRLRLRSTREEIEVRLRLHVATTKQDNARSAVHTGDARPEDDRHPYIPERPYRPLRASDGVGAFHAGQCLVGDRLLARSGPLGLPGRTRRASPRDRPSRHRKSVTPLHFSPNLRPAHLTSLHTYAKMTRYVQNSRVEQWRRLGRDEERSQCGQKKGALAGDQHQEDRLYR